MTSSSPTDLPNSRKVLATPQKVKEEPVISESNQLIVWSGIELGSDAVESNSLDFFSKANKEIGLP